MGFIYKISCKTTNKVYIGQTINAVERRWKAHKSSAKRYAEKVKNANDEDAPISGGCMKLINAINKYGVDDFTIEVLHEAENSQLNDLEKACIATHDSVANGYNIMRGGAYPDKPKTALGEASAESRKKDFATFRKHEILTGLPMYCIYIYKRKTEYVALHKHPLCNHKEFSATTYGSLENAKAALVKHLTDLESGTAVHVAPVKKDLDLPKGIRKLGNCYFVDKTHKGKTYRRSFSGFADDVNKQHAIDFVNAIINTPVQIAVDNVNMPAQIQQLTN